MRRKIIGMTAAFIVLVTVIFVVLFASLHRDTPTERAGYTTVILNEISVLTERIKANPNDTEALKNLRAAVEELERHYTATDTSGAVNRLLPLFYASCVLFALAVFGFCYQRIIRPFRKLEHFSGEIAKGNLDFPLAIPRQNMFGEFSWAFDFMRSELNAARENEATAKQENKALIAAISHDIKTPVSSIRAYAEALSNGMGNTPERQERYLSVILKKSDEVVELTDDLFLHALSDMEKLQLEIQPYNAREMLHEILDPFLAEYGDRLTITSAIPDAVVSADEKRLAQVFENLITNAVKYAPGSPIELSFIAENDALVCEVRDYGTGIAPRDMPFIWNRFYRGGNTEGVAGSGLGLYIVKYIIEKCGGMVRLENRDTGLAATVSLPVENQPIP